TDIAELVALAFIDGEIDEVGVLGGIVFSNRVHLRIRIATVGVVDAQTLTVDGKLLLVIAVVTQEPAEKAGFLGEHRALEIAGADRIVASEVDRSDTRALTFVDLEQNTDATIIGRLGACGHANTEEAITVISLTDALDIGSKSLLGVDTGCRDIHHGQKLRVGETPVALEDRKSTRLNSSHVKISYAVFC